MLVTLWLTIVLSWALRMPCIPCSAVVRAGSRADRARDAWSVTALRTGVVVGCVLLAVSAIGAYALNRAVAAGYALPSIRGLPDTVGAAFVVAILTPWAAWIRLRCHDLHPIEARYPGTRRSGGTVIVVLIVGVAAAQILGSVWFGAEEIHPALAPLLYAALLVGSWIAYRTALKRLFRTATLPV